MGKEHGIPQLWKEVDEAKSDILLRMSKDNVVFPYMEITGHSESFIDFARTSGKDYESRLLQTDSGLVLSNTGIGGTYGKIWQSGDCPIQKEDTTRSWCKLSNGLIVQWGSYVLGANLTTIMFPIIFSTVNPTIVLTNGDTTPTGADLVVGVRDKNQHGMNVVNSKSAFPYRVNWIAIGY